MPKKKPGLSGVFFGWWIVFASGILTFWGQGFGNFGFSVLFKPLVAELGFTRASASIAASVGKFEGGVLSPIVGWVCDRFGPRWMVLSGITIIGISLMLMYFVNSIWSLYLIWGILVGTGATMGFTIPLDKTVANWFVKKRGRALGTKFIFNALSATLMVPLLGWLVSIEGWRLACVTGGIVMLVVGLPLAWYFIRQKRPEYYGLLPDGAATVEDTYDNTQVIAKGIQYAAEVKEIEFTLRQAIKTPAFWLMTLATAGWHLVGAVFVLHSIPFLTDMGFDPVKAALTVGIMSSGVIPGALIGMSIADRLKKEYLRLIIAGAYFTQVVGLGIFLLNPNPTTVYPLLITHHFAAGLSGGLNSVTIARYFGRKAFASIRGTIMMFLLPFTVGGQIYAGWVYDRFGSYMTAFQFCGASVVFAAVIVLLAVPPKPPAHITGIDEIM